MTADRDQKRAEAAHYRTAAALAEAYGDLRAAALHRRRAEAIEGADLASFTCPRCGRTSHNPNDAREGYCGACHDWTGRTGNATPAVPA